MHNKAFNVNTKNLIKQIPSAPSKEAVYDLLQQIRDTNDNGIKGKIYLYLSNVNYMFKIFLIKNYFYRMGRLLSTVICISIIKSIYFKY